MEELQDAIEDAQYVNALHDKNPQPTAEWTSFAPERLQAYVEGVTNLKPSLGTLRVVCSRPIGFYLVRSW